MAIGRLAPWLMLAGLPIFAADYPVVTVCDVLGNLPAYNGKTVIVVGARHSTTEGVWLVATCPKLIVNGAEWGGDLWLSQRGLKNDEPPSLPHDLNWNDDSVTRKLE